MADLAARTSADRRLVALFSDEAAVVARRTGRRRRTVVIALAAVTALLVAGGITRNAFGSAGPAYRITTVGPQPVDSVLTGVATIEPVTQAAVGFPATGTVLSVNVKVGDPVAAGGVLASLETQSLAQSLRARQSTLAQSRLTLEKALSGQSVSPPGSGSSSSSGGGDSGSAVTAAYRSNSGDASLVLTAATRAGPALAAAQQEVLTAQRDVDAAMLASNTAIEVETTACAEFLAASAGNAAATTTPDATACQQAITAVQQAQQALAGAQQSLQAASNALDSLLAQRAATPPPTEPPTPPTTGGETSDPAGPSGDTRSSGTSTTTDGAAGSSPTGSTASSSPTAADLVAYQASVDSATYEVIAAQQALDAATITSPIAGTVVGVNVKVGDSVTAGSSTQNVVVEGPAGYEISTSVSVGNIPSVSIGQTAIVTPDGTRRALSGKVVAISLVPASTTTTSTLYNVIVGLTNPNVPLHNGATGSVAILTERTRAALAVPTSAVTTTRERRVVTVLENGTATIVPVRIGVMGATWTEIKSGLRAGQQVVLADTAAALPGSATANSTQNPTDRFGGFDEGGGGHGGGGLGGAGGNDGG